MRRGFRPAGFLPAAGNRSQDFCLLGKTEVRRGHTPGKNRVRARQGEEKDRVRDLLGAAARVTRLPAQMTLRRGAFARRVSSRPKGTGARPCPCPGKQKPGVGTRPERIACVRGMAKKKTGCASCSPQPRGRARMSAGTKRADRFAGGRRTRSCTAGDETFCADSPAPGRRVRDLLTVSENSLYFSE